MQNSHRRLILMPFLVERASPPVSYQMDDRFMGILAGLKDCLDALHHSQSSDIYAHTG